MKLAIRPKIVVNDPVVEDTYRPEFKKALEWLGRRYLCYDPRGQKIDQTQPQVNLNERRHS